MVLGARFHKKKGKSVECKLIPRAKNDCSVHIVNRPSGLRYDVQVDTVFPTDEICWIFSHFGYAQASYDFSPSTFWARVMNKWRNKSLNDLKYEPECGLMIYLKYHTIQYISDYFYDYWKMIVCYYECSWECGNADVEKCYECMKQFYKLCG